METVARLMLHTKDVLNTYLSSFCDQPIDKVKVDTDRQVFILTMFIMRIKFISSSRLQYFYRDFYMTPTEALSYGLIDEIVKTKMSIKDPKIPSLKVPPPLSIYDLDVVVRDPKKSVQGEKREFKL
jgi:ATP-dependent Clp protease, protease subunit